MLNKTRHIFFKEKWLASNFVFTSNWAKLKIFSRYEMSNCLFEATLQRIESLCNCTTKYFVDIVEGFEACVGTQKQCMSEHLASIGEFRAILDRGEEKVLGQLQIYRKLSDCRLNMKLPAGLSIWFFAPTWEEACKSVRTEFKSNIFCSPKIMI